MFSLAALRLIRNALILSEKSVSRLANREGQPEAVVKEYLNARVAISGVIKDVEALYVEQEAKEKVQGAGKVQK